MSLPVGVHVGVQPIKNNMRSGPVRQKEPNTSLCSFDAYSKSHRARSVTHDKIDSGFLYSNLL